MALRLLVVAFVLLFARQAHADAKTSALSWVRLPGTESCIPTAELGARIEKHLGRSVLVSPSVADISIEGRVEKVGSKFRAVVGGTKRDGTRIGTRDMTSTGADCRALDDGLVLVIALMIDPDALSPHRDEAAPLPPPPVVTHEIIREHVIEIDHVPAESPSWRTEASLRGAAEFERIPGVAPGVMLAFRAGPTRLAAFQISVGVVPGGALNVGSPSVGYTMLEGGLAWCPSRALGSRFAIGGCAGLRFGDVHASGSGFTTSRDVDRGFADLALGPELAVDVAGPVYVVASANALVHFVREQTLANDGNGQPYELAKTGLVGGEIGIGIGAHFSP